MFRHSILAAPGQVFDDQFGLRRALYSRLWLKKDDFMKGGFTNALWVDPQLQGLKIAAKQAVLWSRRTEMLMNRVRRAVFRQI